MTIITYLRFVGQTLPVSVDFLTSIFKTRLLYAQQFWDGSKTAEKKLGFRELGDLSQRGCEYNEQQTQSFFTTVLK